MFDFNGNNKHWKITLNKNKYKTNNKNNNNSNNNNDKRRVVKFYYCHYTQQQKHQLHTTNTNKQRFQRSLQTILMTRAMQSSIRNSVVLAPCTQSSSYSSTLLLLLLTVAITQTTKSHKINSNKSF